MARVQYTHTGHKLTFREAKLIEYIIAGKSEKEAYLMAGFECSDPNRYKLIMGKKHIQDELDYRFQQIKEASIASAVEILNYYSDVMRGKVKDQFGLDAPLAERTKAANELAKRVIDYQRELEVKSNAQDINITLNWDRDDKKGD